MAWTAPRTWVTSEVVTASVMNTHVRDNLLVTAPAVASSAGSFIVVNGTNSVAQRTPTDAIVSATETSASTSYTDLATSGPAVTLTTTTKAIAFFASAMRNDTANARNFMSIAVSGATTISASDNFSLNNTNNTANEWDEMGTFHLFDTLTGGSNTFTAKYKVDGGTGSWARRRLLIIPL